MNFLRQLIVIVGWWPNIGPASALLTSAVADINLPSGILSVPKQPIIKPFEESRELVFSSVKNWREEMMLVKMRMKRLTCW